MQPELANFLILLPIAVGAGFFGALFGLGGGIILIPGITLLLGYPVKDAVAASAISVIATSSAAASAYVAERITNIRLGMVLELATTTGALVGSLVAVYIRPQLLYFIFAAMLVYAGTSMARGRRAVSDEDRVDLDRQGLDGEFTDPATGRVVSYDVRNVPLGMLGSGVAGVLSGLLGVGGGIIKVPVMNRVMGVPLKAAIATSNFTIGVTAATAAAVYWSHGMIKPAIAAPSAIGVLVGARIGSRVAGMVPSKVLRIGFVIFVAITAVQMVQKGIEAWK
jgi:uncharacterized membrane protein YfcA